jgi:tRNA-2-methylthio-N6-dimethylallyladenosine synthase
MPGFSVTTFGCQMNQHDSERMAEVLKAGGVRAADGDPDVIVLNTCSVREKAEQKLRSEVGRLARLKRERPELVLVVAGCMAQQEGEKILRAMPHVDLVVGPDNIPELPALIAEIRLGGPPAVRTVFDVDSPRFLTAPGEASGRVTAFVTTMKGCNERCSFCVVPNTRGPERYRPSREIVAEIAELSARGVREVTLLGQTVNSYRDPLRLLGRAPDADPDDEDESEFAALLRAICAEVPALLRLRYTSPHPRHLTPSLIAAHRDLPQLPRHVHLPVQSGSDRMLKRMIRRHTRAEYLARITTLRTAVPDVTLSSDVIVGFPGESEEDFAATLTLVAEAGFTGVFGFKYSPRPDTPALKLGDDVSEAVKSERLARLFAQSEAQLGAHLAAQVGKTLEVLVEGPSKANGTNATGRSERNEIVHVADALDRAGELCAVTIEQAFKHSLFGRIAGDSASPGVPRPKTARRALPLVAG